MKRLILLLVVALTTLSIKAQDDIGETVQVAVQWTATVGVDYIPAVQTLTKTAENGWNNAGARSVNRLEANEDGKITYTITETTTRKAIGLSTKNNNHKVKSIDYALVLNRKKLIIYEHGKFKGKFGRIKVGDTFTVERLGNKIVYKKNGKIFRKRKTNPKHRL